MNLQKPQIISLIVMLSFVAVGVMFSPSVEAQSISISSWSFSQDVDRQIGSIVACRSNAPTGGDFADSDQKVPFLRARAEVKVSGNPVSHCRITVEAEARITVHNEPTLVTVHCENRGQTVLDDGSVAVTGAVFLNNVTGLSNLEFAKCNAPSPTPMGTHNVIEMQDRTICLEPGNYLVRGKLMASSQIGTGAVFDTADANFLDRVPHVGLKIWTTSGGACENPRSFSSIMGFDLNGNRFIEDTEFFMIADAWIAGEMSDELFFAALDFWINITPVDARRVFELEVSNPVSLDTQISRNSISFAAAGQNVSKMAVEVYGLNGMRISNQTAIGTKLRWNMRNSSSQALANGIYLVKVNALGVSGEILAQETQKILILR